MKTASKIFIWMGMILGGVLIFPIVVGILALKKINRAQSFQELQTMGVLTLLFCSFLGGIFMLCIKNEELCFDSNVNIIKYEKKTVDNNNFDANMIGKVKTCNTFCLCLLTVLAVVCFVFALIPMVAFGGYGEFGSGIACLVFSILAVVISVITVIVYFVKERNNNSLTITLLFVLFAFAVLVLISSIFGWLDTYTCSSEYVYSYWLQDYHWEVVYCYEVAWQYWVSFGCSCLMLVVILFELIFCLVMQKKVRPVKNVTEKIVKNRLEVELEKLQKQYTQNLSIISFSY